ncbi:MAG: aspartate kinase [Anaerolineae bacterium]
MNTLVMKFGGSAIGTTTTLAQVLSIVLHEHEQWDHVVLVVSALEGVTDALIEAAHLAQLGQQRGYRRIVANLRTRHLALIEELPFGGTERAALQADIDRLLFDMLDIYQSMAQSSDNAISRASIDATIGVGEKMAARIIAALLRQNALKSVAIDTTSLIVTDEVFGNATPNMVLTRQQIGKNLLPLLERDIVPVITGFIGATSSGQPTTLGRGGSDYTASVLGVCVNATEIWIWTDVDGMMTADPREVESAKVIPQLSYEEAAELAYFGARVLHARMIGPVSAQKIPLYVKNINKPQKTGTLIHHYEARQKHELKAVTSITGLVVEAERDGNLTPVTAVYDKSLFSALPGPIDVIVSSQSSSHALTCFLIPTTAGVDAIHSIRSTLEEGLHDNPLTAAWAVKTAVFVTAICSQLNEWAEVTAAIFRCMKDINIIAISQSPSRCSLSLVVESKDAETALYNIHRLISDGIA